MSHCDNSPAGRKPDRVQRLDPRGVVVGVSVPCVVSVRRLLNYSWLTLVSALGEGSWPVHLWVANR